MTTNRFVGVVCGLKSEAAALRDALRREGLDGPIVSVGVSGADAARAEMIARRFVNEGAMGILSVGVSGGLDPALAPGDLVGGTDVVSGTSAVQRSNGGLSDVDAILGSAFAQRMLYGAEVIVRTAADKASIFARTRAAAVDMESLGAARAASSGSVPFLALRAIADPAERALPNAALGAVASDGSTRVLSTLMKCAKSPGDFPALLQLGADSEKALKALRGSLGSVLRRFLLGLDL